MGARISVSSMRTDPISVPLVRALAASGTQTLTIAPEAGSERLRPVISKTQSEDDLLAAVELAQALGFPSSRCTSWWATPREKDDDIQGIVDLTLKARRSSAAISRSTPRLRAQGAHAIPMDGDDARKTLRRARRPSSSAGKARG